MQKPPPGWEGLLDDDEEILWQGQPAASLHVRPKDLAESLFGCFFAGFAIFWISMASSMGAPRNAPGIFQFFPLFGLPFLAVGLYMIFGKFFWRAYQRRHTNYTLTNKRGFIATNLFGTRKLTNYPLTDSIQLEETSSGDFVWFATRRVTSRGKRGTSTRDVPVGFELIPEGRKVFALAQKAQKGAA